MKRILSILLILVAGCQTPAEKPNFVFIFIDDLGWADIGCYGNEYNETPNIDRLAEQGMRFTDAYAAAPVCSPSRAALLSGQYPAHVGIIDFITGHWRPYEKLIVPKNRTQYLAPEVVTIAEALKPAGYTSAAFGKWHLGGGTGREPVDQGFDRQMRTFGWGHFFPPVSSKPEVNIPEGSYLSDVLTDQAVEFIAENKDRPFFLYLSHFAVHIPLEAKEPMIEKYKNKTGPEGKVNNPIYAAMIEHIDESVGRVVKQVDDLGLAENTLVVFYSDNGGLFKRFDGQGVEVTNNDPLRDEKGSLYEGGIREPLIMRWSGQIAAGSESGVAVTGVDFYPTFLELAGAPVPAQLLDGESLVPVFTRSGELEREAIFWHYPVYHHSTPAGAIRAGDFKLLEFFDDGHLELYNLRDDISENNNLAQTMPEKATELQKKLAAWRGTIGAEMPVLNPDFDAARRFEWGRHPDRN